MEATAHTPWWVKSAPQHNADDYVAVRMVGGKKVHLRKFGSSVTECGSWTGNTHQFSLDTKEITCVKCAHAMNTYIPEAFAAGFTTTK